LDTLIEILEILPETERSDMSEEAIVKWSKVIAEFGQVPIQRFSEQMAPYQTCSPPSSRGPSYMHTAVITARELMWKV